MTIFNHLQHAKQWELYLVVWNLHSSSQKRWWGVKTPAPTFKPALLQAWRSTQVHWLFRGRGKRSDQLVSQTRSLKFQYIVGSKEFIFGDLHTAFCIDKKTKTKKTLLKTLLKISSDGMYRLPVNADLCTLNQHYLFTDRWSGQNIYIMCTYRLLANIMLR